MKQLFICSYLFLHALVLQATHNRAGEILYRRIAPYTQVVGTATVQVYTYSITVVKYTDDGAGIADRCIDTVYFGDGTKGIAPRINGPTSCACGSHNGTTIACGSLIVNNPGYTVKKNIYSITHTYPGPGTYVIKSADPNRNQGVHNIPNSVNAPFHLESTLILNSTLGQNSSPVLTNPPVDQATLGVCFYHNPSAADADGDSLSYEVIPCLGTTGYFFPETGAGGSFSINAQIGLLEWCAPQFLSEYNIAIRITEWRKNGAGVPQIIGQVIRDMQVLVKYGVVGLPEKVVSDAFHVQPNPFKDQMYLDAGNTVSKWLEVSLYTLEGRKVFGEKHEHVKNRLTLNTQELPAGIYILEINTENGSSHRKVIRN